MDEFTEMSKVGSLRWFVIDICFMISRVCFFGNWKVLIFFLLSPAGNVLLTEDGTVKLGKAWDVTLLIVFPCAALKMISSPYCTVSAP